MRMSVITVLALALVGCETSQQSAPLTAAQAGAVATRLANDKADSLFHHRPFRDGQPAKFEGGHWVWVGSRGVNIGDFQARVELAADGSTNSVQVQLLDDMLRPTKGFRIP